MTHKFDVKNKHKLDNAQRRSMLPPEKTLMTLGLKEGDIMADIGCGIGYFSIPASEIVGNSGKVYAMDVSEEMLNDVEKKIAENSIANIETRITDGGKLNLDNGDITFALISNVLHEVEDKGKMLGDIKRLLGTEGRIAIIEWEKIDSEFGPPKDHRLDKEELAKMMKSVGFRDISFVELGENFYGITAK